MTLPEQQPRPALAAAPGPATAPAPAPPAAGCRHQTALTPAAASLTGGAGKTGF